LLEWWLRWMLELLLWLIRRLYLLSGIPLWISLLLIIRTWFNIIICNFCFICAFLLLLLWVILFCCWISLRSMCCFCFILVTLLFNYWLRLVILACTNCNFLDLRSDWTNLYWLLRRLLPYLLLWLLLLVWCDFIV